MIQNNNSHDFCPKCMGTKKYLNLKFYYHKNKRYPRFKYKDCTYCDENGQVPSELYDEYNLHPVFND